MLGVEERLYERPGGGLIMSPSGMPALAGVFPPDDDDAQRGLGLDNSDDADEFPLSPDDAFSTSNASSSVFESSPSAVASSTVPSSGEIAPLTDGRGWALAGSEKTAMAVIKK